MLIEVSPVNSTHDITINSDQIITVARAKVNLGNTEIFLVDAGVIEVNECYAEVIALLNPTP